MVTGPSYPFTDLQTEEGLESLNSYLKTCSYLNGAHPTKDDTFYTAMITSPVSIEKFPHVARWYKHITYFPTTTTKLWPLGKIKTAQKVQKKDAPTKSDSPTAAKVSESTTPVKSQTKPSTQKPKEEDDDDFDVFADDDDAEEVAKQLSQKRQAEKESKKEKPKDSRINKSSLVIEIKPYDGSVNLDNVKNLVWNIKMEGLTWGEAFRKVPLAFGLYKLQMNCTIIDELVDTDGILEAIEILGLSEESAKEYIAKREAGTLDDEEEEEEDDENLKGMLVQGAEIISFNKL